MNPSERYDSLFIFYANGRNVAWKLLKAQVFAESNFKPTAVSSVGAKGLAQFMDSTWREYSSGDPFNPEHSIEAQAKFMDRLVASFNGDVELALASYNWGIGRVKARLIKFNTDKWADIERYAPDETKEYVKKIIDRYGEYCREL